MPGLRFAQTAEKAAVVGVERLTGEEIQIAATRQARAILTMVEEVTFGASGIG